MNQTRNTNETVEDVPIIERFSRPKSTSESTRKESSDKRKKSMNYTLKVTEEERTRSSNTKEIDPRRSRKSIPYFRQRR